jgi:AhpD family alkylhydroperoxidase
MTHPQRPAFARLDVFRQLPDGYRALSALEEAVGKSGLEPRLLELVRTRVSQLNGCAFCLDMHQRAARTHGETAQRLDLVAGWRDAPCYDARERAAFALAEALTLVAGRGLPEEVWQDAARVLDPRELSALCFAVAAINAWNRLCVASGATPALRAEPAA